MSLAGQREQVLQSLTAEPLDVLVVGGGIVGSGIARDAAMRGLKVGLVEQHDFAFGTSSRSSRLLHGGLRYLAQGRIGLVHEASIEKKIIHHIAPHLAEPLPFIFPTYRVNKNWVLWQLKIGVKVYDWLCGGRNLGKSTWLSKAEVLKKVPSLSPANLDGAVRYFDGFTNDARLTIDTLRSAQKHGAVLLNYCKFENADSVSGRWQCELTDKAGQACGLPDQKGEFCPLDEPSCRPLPPHPALSPGGGEGGRRPGEGVVQGAKAQNSGLENSLPGQAGRVSYAVSARAVVNATGPWADGLPHSDVHLRITKGIHVVVERARVPVPDTVVMTEGKRILFAIPWSERTIIGTTDTDYTGSLDHVTADAEEVRYLLQITNQFFPNARLAEPDVISTWAGLRPLIADPNGKPSDISRGHEIRSPEPGWWDVAGGKLTTYRLMAEQTVDQIVKTLKGLKELSRELPPCRTADEPLLPAADIAGVSGILPPEFSRRAVEHYCANEWAVHLDDVMVRRTSWHYYFRDAVQRAECVADWMGELLGWSEATRAAELTRYKQATSLGDSDPRSPTALVSAA